MLDFDHFEDVVQIKMSVEMNGQPLYWVAAYLVDGLLVDTGCAHTCDEFVNYLKDQHIETVVNTHYHEDHVAANKRLQQTRTLNIFAHPESVPLINTVLPLLSYQELVWGYPEPSEVLPLGSQIASKHYKFEVIETPGHCDGHVALVELSKGWCFSGDLFSSENLKVIRPAENIAQIVSSMKILLNIDTPRLVLFTSLGRIIPEGRHALNNCVSYLKEKSYDARQLQKKGYDVEAIMHNLFGGESSLAALTDNQFSSINLVRSLLQMCAEE